MPTVLEAGNAPRDTYRYFCAPVLKAALQHIDFGETSIIARRRTEPRYLFEWHFHPYYELTLIAAGRGTRFVGHHVGEYQPGDLVLLGPDVPHTYVSASGSELAPHVAVYVLFRQDTFGTGLLDLPEMLAVGRLLDRAPHGLHLTPAVDVIDSVAALPDATPTGRLVSLLQILVELSHTPAATLSDESTISMLDSVGRQRIEAACRHVAQHYQQGKIPRDDVARAVHLSPTAFSRFFAASMGRPFSRYVNEVRTRAACGLLATELPVATIASDVGYGTLANFNRQFRRLRGVSPTEYRRQQLATMAGEATPDVGRRRAS